MGTLYKRGKIYWAQIWQYGRRVRMSLETDNFGVARSKMRTYEHQVETHGLHRPTNTSPGEILQAFADDLKARNSHKSVQTDLGRLREFFGAACTALEPGAGGTKPAVTKRAAGASGKPKKQYAFAAKIMAVEDVTTAMVSDFLIKIKKARDLSDKTSNEYREVLHRFFDFAFRHGVRMHGEPTRNPVAEVKRFRIADPVIRYLKIDEIHQQLDALNEQPQLRAMVAVYIYAGLRREEALWLRVDDNDVDLENRMIHIRAKIVGERRWKPKTGVNRSVPISDALMIHLQAYRPRPSDHSWYFPSPEGKWDHPDNLSHRLADLNKKAGMPWGCLDFRHTFGSQLAQAGRSLYQIATLMGNSPQICQKHYAHLSQSSLTKCVDFD